MHTRTIIGVAFVAGVALAPSTAVAQDAQPPVFTSVAVSGTAACALTDAGVVYCWGTAEFDQSLSLDERQRVARPLCGWNNCSLSARRVPLTGPAAQVFMASNLSRSNPGARFLASDVCALSRDGLLWCWTAGGIATVNVGAVRFRVMSIGGADHTCGLDADGASWCWGISGEGQLGDGNRTHERQDICQRDYCDLMAVRTAGTTTLRSIGVGGDHTCGLATDSTAYCWGPGRNGRIGDGTGHGRNVPTAVAGGRKFRTLTVGAGHACGIATDGVTYCWGMGGDGQLGADALTDSREPAAVPGGLEFTSISAGTLTTCALTAEGTAYCWGRGKNGQRGDGTLTERVAHPVAVAGDQKFASLTIGNEYACGVLLQGRGISCWGRNDKGQLGNGTKDDSQVPTRVVMR